MTDSLSERPSRDTSGVPFQRGLRLVIAGAATLGCVAGVVGAAISGNGVLALLFAGATVLASVVFIQVLLLRQFVPRASSDGTGTTLQTPRGFDLLSLTTFVGAILLAVPWAVLGTLHEVSVPFPDKLRYGYVLLFGWLIFFSARVVFRYVQNGGVGRLRFTPDEFVLAEAFWRQKGAWADVTAITDEAPVRAFGVGKAKLQQKEAYALCAMTIVMADGTKAAIGNASYYARDGDALRDWVRFYWEHPEHRAELGDDRAVERLRAGRTTSG